MLRAIFTADDDSITLMVNGHAGQADIGHDIVCSSCSILTYMVAQIVKSEAKEGSMRGKPVVMLNSGNAVISCEPKPEKYNEILHAFYCAEVGYTLLAHNYPQFVELQPFTQEESENGKD